MIPAHAFTLSCDLVRTIQTILRLAYALFALSTLVGVIRSIKPDSKMLNTTVILKQPTLANYAHVLPSDYTRVLLQQSMSVWQRSWVSLVVGV